MSIIPVGGSVPGHAQRGLHQMLILSPGLLAGHLNQMIQIGVISTRPGIKPDVLPN